MFDRLRRIDWTNVGIFIAILIALIFAVRSEQTISRVEERTETIERIIRESCEDQRRELRRERRLRERSEAALRLERATRRREQAAPRAHKRKQRPSRRRPAPIFVQPVSPPPLVAPFPRRPTPPRRPIVPPGEEHRAEPQECPADNPADRPRGTSCTKPPGQLK